MHKSKKILALLIVLCFGILFILQYIFNNKIIRAIETELPPNLELNYNQINTNILKGAIELDSLSFKLTHTNKNTITVLKAKHLKIAGFSLWQYIFNKTISIDNVIFEYPDVHHYQTQKKEGNKETSTSKKQFDKKIKIGNISLKMDHSKYIIMSQTNLY
ncbi:hypothetical protein [Aureibaculum luteum]|uniref:hypothetical protein n=1 Tax=Aureibaculum luteum TaxID=1548456 RepID=UPI000E50BF7A|nr:hypothetical protein [Aureibaculum luteum]